MPKYTTNGWTTREALMDREPFTTYGALRAELGGSPWNTGRLPEPWSAKYADDARDNLITYTVFSYSTPIGWVLTDGTVVVPPVKYSITTSGHQGMLYALDKAKLSQDSEAGIRDSAQNERERARERRHAAQERRAAESGLSVYLRAAQEADDWVPPLSSARYVSTDYDALINEVGELSKPVR